MFNIVKDMANLLEHAGIPITEKTKELQEKLQTANKNLTTAWKEKEVIEEELKVSNKDNYIHTQLKGMAPEIVNSAMEHFKDKDILDVQEELQSFLDGDFSGLDMEMSSDDMIGDISLDQVQQACEDIESEENQRVNASNEVNKDKKKVFESLGKGLNSKKSLLNSNSDVTEKSLNESKQAQDLAEMDDDVKEAKEQIDDFDNLGFHFS